MSLVQVTPGPGRGLGGPGLTLEASPPSAPTKDVPVERVVPEAGSWDPLLILESFGDAGTMPPCKAKPRSHGDCRCSWALLPAGHHLSARCPPEQLPGDGLQVPLDSGRGRSGGTMVLTKQGSQGCNHGIQFSSISSSFAGKTWTGPGEVPRAERAQWHLLSLGHSPTRGGS